MKTTPHYIVHTNTHPNSRIRLIVFPPAGAGPAFYRAWQSKLPDTIEVCPVLMPRRELRLRETPIQQLDIILDMLLDEFPAFLDKPFAIFGHSFGALLAFEFARRLHDELLPLPKALFVSGCRALHLPVQLPHLHTLPDDAFMSSIADMGGIPAEILQHPDYVAHLLSILRADMTLFETYRFRQRPILPVPLYALGGTEDKLVTEDELIAWQEHTRREFEFKLFEGGHFYLQSEENALINYLIKTLGYSG